MNWIDKLLEVVQKLGSLAPAAIFALGDVALGWYIWQMRKDAVVSSESWRTTREKGIASDVAHTEAIKQMAEKVGSLEMSLMKFLIKE